MGHFVSHLLKNLFSDAGNALNSALGRGVMTLISSALTK